MATKKKRPGYGKILDAWDPPQGAGDPVGCVATTFTFDPVFFEEECLSRFLRLESDPVVDGPFYLIEREEKLSGISCASVLVDQNYCRGQRSLRWDLLSARVPDGILHGKISLLYWTNLVRLIVASANLTEDGYRRNREIFGVVDFGMGKNAPLDCLDGVIDFLREAAEYARAGRTPFTPATARWNSFLDRVVETTGDWGSRREGGRSKEVQLYALCSGPGRSDVFTALEEIWPSSSPPRRAWVTSPFFDPPESPNRPAREIWNLLNRRGEATVSYLVTAEELEEGEELFIHAPESIMKAEPRSRKKARTIIERIKGDEDKEDQRPLHLKNIWLENDQWAVYLIGSSNFTSAGLGLSRGSNLEANLVYLVSNQKNRPAYLRMAKSFPESEKIGSKVRLKWQPVLLEGGEDAPSADNVLLPPFFGEAVYLCDDAGKTFVILTFNPEAKSPSGWTIHTEDGETVFYNETEWKKSGEPNRVKLLWQNSNPPSGFEARWKGEESGAWWPVNVESAASLPPPEELRDLPLEVLISVLTSARPLHQVMRRWIKKNLSRQGEIERPIIDPLERVDTSGFLMKRTRRVSWALTALRVRLERPVPTREALKWRLRGPVGAIALAGAIMREARNKNEEPFLLAELALELGKVEPAPAPGCLDPKEIKREIKKVIKKMKIGITDKKKAALPSLRDYINRAFKEALR